MSTREQRRELVLPYLNAAGEVPNYAISMRGHITFIVLI
jgi:hypothetical protein